MRSPCPSPHIALKDVGKSYGKRNKAILAIESVTLDIARGEFLSILGPSGCGKSTLLMMIAGLVPPTRGLIEVGQRPVTQPLTDVGIAFQQDLLFDWRTVLGNVMVQADMRGLDRAAARAKARALLQRVGLAAFETRRPWELSGGMRQRVAICRTLLHGASMLLLDEPFGALDALTRDQMNVHLQNLWIDERPTAVMVTHSISEAVFLSDRVIVLSSRPARFLHELQIELPRPRTMEMRDASEFVRLQHRLRQAIEMPQ
ncbi:MAG TPA: ABC transporter ATP-binding protein [Xanthobacteraceae bacterium]|jgi:NitT/TauT family transport system ATP-binding protein